jgi:hypothetical protein
MRVTEDPPIDSLTSAIEASLVGHLGERASEFKYSGLEYLGTGISYEN